MAEELDISNIITNNVNGYLNPKNKIYRLNVCDAYIDYGEYEGIELQTTIKIKTIEVIDDEEEYNKLVHNIPVGWESDDDIKIATENKFEIGYLMYKRCSYMYKDIVQNTIITDHNNFSAIYSDNIKVKNRINISRRLKEQKLLQQEQNIKLIKKVKEHDKKYTMTFK